MTNISVSLDQVRWFRLRRSGLVSPFGTPEAAAGALFGVQAQILPAAALALWNRTSGLTHSRFEHLLYVDRTLVKLWGQRNTLHVYPSAEWPLVFGAISASKTWWGSAAERQNQHDEYSALVEQAALLLRERGVMGRTDLRAAGFDLADEHLSPWGGLFADLVRRGYACHAGREDNEGLFAHRAHWLPDLAWDPPAADEANREALRRYLRAYGPSTMRDFIYWRGAKSANGRHWWDALAPELVEVEFDGASQFVLREDLDDLLTPAADVDWPVRMLYRFDPLLLAHKDKHWIVPPAHYKQVWRPAGHIEGIVLAHGHATATWRYERRPGGLAITVDPFGRFPKALQKQIERIATQVAKFFGTPLAELNIAS